MRQSNLRLLADIKNEIGKVAGLEREAADARKEQQQVEIDLARANTNFEHAKAEAEHARADAAKAQQAAADASLAAMRERAELEHVEYLSLPRRLNDLHQSEYLSALRKYAGTKFFIVTLSDTEPLRTARMIERLLESSGWLTQPMIRYSEADESQIPDRIWIEANGPIVGPPASPLMPAMDALRHVLSDSDIRASRTFLNPKLPPARLPPETLRVVIGLKPDAFEMKRLEREWERERGARRQLPSPLPTEKSK